MVHDADRRRRGPVFGGEVAPGDEPHPHQPQVTRADRAIPDVEGLAVGQLLAHGGDVDVLVTAGEQRQLVHGLRARDARLGGEPDQGFLDGGAGPWRLGVASHREDHGGGGESLGAEAQVDPLQGEEAPAQQPGSHQQQDGQGQLRDD